MPGFLLLAVVPSAATVSEHADWFSANMSEVKDHDMADEKRFACNSDKLRRRRRNFSFARFGPEADRCGGLQPLRPKNAGRETATIGP